MAASRKKGLFHQIKDREIGKQKKIKLNECYLLIITPYASIPIDNINEFFSDNPNNNFKLFIGKLQPHQTFGEAEVLAMTEIQKYFDTKDENWLHMGIKTQIKESRLIQGNGPILKEDLCECAYWIFTMKCNSQEMSNILSNLQKPETVSAKAFAEKILRVQDNSGKHIYSREDYLREHKLATKCGPATTLTGPTETKRTP